MKNQYFGDVNDFLKYGILRGLARNDVRLLVAWMLTPDDGRSDGRFTRYLSQPESWRHFDPDLFDFLRSHLDERGVRAVRTIEAWPGLRASFLSDVVPDNRHERDSWSDRFEDRAASHDLVFVDPDNGVEVPSCPKGRKNSSKYVLWDELVRIWGAGSSLIIYQHFPRVQRDRFLHGMASEFRTRLGVPDVLVFRTPRVAFFLLPQGRWGEAARARGSEIAGRWAPHVTFEAPT